MVKRLLVFCLLILPALFSLTTCDLFIAVFSLSPFPGYLAQTVASVDMRDEVETFLGSEDENWRSDVFVLKNSASNEGVFLIVRKDTGGQWVYVFDPSLALITKSHIDQHSDISLVDANQDFFVGSILFNGADLQVAAMQPGGVPGYWDRPAIADPPMGNYVLRTGASELRYDEFNSSWVQGGSDLFATTTGSPNDLQLRGAGVDGPTVYLFFHGYDSGENTEVLRIVVTPLTDYPNSFTGPLITSYPTSTAVRRIENDSRVYYTRKGIVAMTYNNNHVLLKPNGDRIKVFYVTSEREPSLDFDIDGKYYYVFDKQNLRLYKAATGFIDMRSFRIRKLALPLVLLLPLASVPVVHAQKAVELNEVRRLVLYFEIGEGSEFTPQQRTLLYESLMAGLSDASDRVALLERNDVAIPTGDQGKSVTAEDMGADAWLHVVAVGDFESASLRVRCLDLLNGIIAFDLDLQKELIRGTRELGMLFWIEVEAAVTDYFETALSLENRIGDLTFEALPGTRIEGITSRRLKMPEAGTVAAEVPLPSTMGFRATKPGYWPVEGQIYMDQPEKMIVLEQTPGDRVALDVYLNNFNFPGIDFTYFLVPEFLYAKTGFLTYLAGFVLRGDEERNVFVSYSLNHYNIALGLYLNAPDRYIRPYFSAGAFWRIITARGYWGFEPIAPFGLQPTLGIEYARQRRYKLFLEYAPMIHWTGNIDDTFLFLLSIPADDDFSGYWAHSWSVINILNFKLGLRVRL